MYLLSLLYSVSLIGASISSYDAVAEAAKMFVASPDRIDQLLKLKGLNTDGSKLSTAEYVSYMSSLFRVKRSPRDWVFTPTEALIHAMLRLKPRVAADGSSLGLLTYEYETITGSSKFTCNVETYSPIGDASALQTGFIKDVVSGASSLAQELTHLKSSSVLGSSVLSEGGSFHRLAFFLDYFAHLFAQRPYIDYKLVHGVYDACDSWMKNHDTEAIVKPGAVLRWIRSDGDGHAPNWTAYALFSLWKSESVNPGLFYKVPEMAAFLRKFRELLDFRGANYILIFDEVLASFYRMAPLLAESLNAVNPNEQMAAYLEIGETDDEDVGLAEFSDLVSKLSINPEPAPAPVAASTTSAPAQRSFGEIFASRMFESPWDAHRTLTDLEDSSQFNILDRLSDLTRTELDSDFEASWLSDLLESSDLDIEAVSDVLMTFGDDEALAEFRGAIMRVQRLGLDMRLSHARAAWLTSVLVLCEFSVLAGLPKVAVAYAKKIPLVLGDKGWRLLPEVFFSMAGVFQVMPHSERHIESVEFPFRGSDFLGDYREARAFDDLLVSLRGLRSSVHVPLKSFIFKDLADIAFLAGVGCRDKALSMIGGITAKQVENEIIAYSFYGWHLPTIREKFPQLLTNASDYYMRLRKGDLHAVMAEVASIIEHRQKVAMTFESLQGVDLEESKMFGSLARFIFRGWFEFSSVAIEPSLPDIRMRPMRLFSSKLELVEVRWDRGGNVIEVPIERSRLGERTSFWLWILKNPSYVGVLGNLLSLMIEGLPRKQRYLPLLCMGLSYHIRHIGKGALSIRPDLVREILNEYISEQRERSAQLEVSRRSPAPQKMARSLEDDTSPDTVLNPPGNLD